MALAAVTCAGVARGGGHGGASFAGTSKSKSKNVSKAGPCGNKAVSKGTGRFKGARRAVVTAAVAEDASADLVEALRTPVDAVTSGVDEVASSLDAVVSSMPSYEELSGTAVSVVSDAVASSESTALAISAVSDIDPVVLAGGGGALIAVAAIATALGGRGPAFESASPAGALDRLAGASEDGGKAVLLDLRSSGLIRTDGVPDVRGVGASVAAVAFDATDEDSVASFGARAAKKVSGKTSVVALIDADGTSVTEAAKSLASTLQERAKQAADAAGADTASVTKIVVVSGGAITWRNQELPWREPVTFSFPSLSLEGLDIEIDAETAKSVGLAGAAAGSVALVYTEIETLLELLGVVAVAQIVAKKFLFAEDRKKTLAEIQDFLDATNSTEALGKLSSGMKELRDMMTKFVADTGVAEVVASAAEAAEPSNSSSTSTNGAAATAAAAEVKLPAEMDDSAEFIISEDKIKEDGEDVAVAKDVRE